MIDNQQVNVYNFGFTFNSIAFCWKNKNLYRMPYDKNQRFYEKRMLKLQKIGGSFGYWICGKFKSLTNLKEITTNINFEETIFIGDKLPF